MTDTVTGGTSVQILHDARGAPEYAVVPHAEFEALLTQARRAVGIAAAADAIRAETSRLAFIPSEVVHRIAKGEHPVRVWRLHRGLKAVDLAREVGISPGLLSEIESGKKDCPFRTMREIARLLDLKLDDLVPAIDQGQIDEHRREVQLRDIARRISEIDSMINGSAGFDSGAVRDAAHKLITEAEAFMRDRDGKFGWLETVVDKARTIINEINATERSIVGTVTETQGRLAEVFSDSLVRAGLFPRDMVNPKKIANGADQEEDEPVELEAKPQKERPRLGRPQPAEDDEPTAANDDEAREEDESDEATDEEEERPRGWFLR